MVVKTFWQEPDRTQLETRLTAVDGDRVQVDDTIFFAFSGGQESDRGSIAARPVLLAENHGREIVYTLQSTAGLKVGDRVTMRIDGARRRRLMRLHFAAELVLELVYQSHSQVKKTGAHIAADKARIDFQWAGNIAGIFPELQARVDQIIADDRTITCDFSDRAGERRFWKIDGFAEVPCGGTHVKSTGEIGALRFKRKNPGRGLERIEIYLDD